ncbi:MAG TPA: tetratricopeptide repeat protein [Coleofasciculaceae cyanobacterium]
MFFSKSFDSYIERGNNHFQHNNLEAAFREFNKAVEVASNRTEQATAYFNRGRIYSRMDNMDAAIADFDQVTSIVPIFSQTYLERGNCFQIKGDYFSAITDYDRVIALGIPEPDLAFVFLNRSAAYEAVGNFTYALVDANRAIEMMTDFMPAYEQRDKIQDKLQASGQPSSFSSEENTRTAEQLYQYGNAAHTQNDLISALALFSRAIELSDPNPSFYYLRGIVNAKPERYKESLSDLTTAIELHPQFPAALAERGLVYVELGEHSQALLDYDKAIEIDPTYAITHINKGSLLAIQERWQDALQYLNIGIALQPTPEAHFNRAIVYEKIGDYHHAMEDRKVAESLFNTAT